MYTAAFGIDDDEVLLGSVRAAGFGHLVTIDASGEIESTALPFLVDDSLTMVRAHVARSNPQWRSIDGRTALMIVPGPDAYISPNWYASKAEHHRVVPTTNYGLVHIRGTVTVHHEPAWKLALVRDLTDQFERLVDDSTQAIPWSVDDAPRDFIEKQLTGIVGVEIAITRSELKLKLSQNKPEADRAGATSGLGRSSRPQDLAVAELMKPPTS